MQQVKSYLEASQERIKVHKALIDEAGRRQISNILTNSQDPYQSIAEIQSSRSLNFPRASPALSFLDVLQCSRSTVYQNLLENLKRKLDSQLDTITDESKLKIMLKETIGFMPVRDLKQVPISIIKRLTNVPVRVLNLLAEYGFLMDVPLNVRRKAWEINIPLFCKTIDVHCRSYLADSRRSDGPIKQLSECIGNSEKLFSAFADYCALKVREESAPSWGCLIRNVLTSNQETADKISALGKLHDLSGLLGHCVRQGKIDVKNIITIVETIKFFVVTQFTKLEAAYRADYEIAFLARAEYSRTRNVNNSTAAALPVKIKAKSTTSVGSREVSAPQPKRVRDIEVAAKHVATVPKPIKALSPQEILKSMFDVFMDAYTFLKKLDNNKTFLLKVTDDIAPGYSRLIKNPMYLKKIYEKIKAMAYQDISDMSDDVNLMFDNCVAFNNPTSSYGKLAISLQRKWEGAKDKFASRLASIKCGPKSSSSNTSKPRPNVPPPPLPASTSASVSVSERPREVKIHKKLVIQESDSEEEEFGGAVKKQKTSYHSAATMPPSRPLPVPPRSPVKVSPYSSLVLEIDKDMDDKEALRVTLEAAWQFISDSDKDNIFATAVTDAIAPGYSAEITEPMNLSLMQLKIGRRKYKSLDTLDRDAQLMFNNCVQYDKNLSFYSVIAKELSKLWSGARRLLEAALEVRESIGVKSASEDLAKIAEKLSLERAEALAAEEAARLLEGAIDREDAHKAVNVSDVHEGHTVAAEGGHVEEEVGGSGTCSGRSTAEMSAAGKGSAEAMDTEQPAVMPSDTKASVIAASQGQDSDLKIEEKAVLVTSESSSATAEELSQLLPEGDDPVSVILESTAPSSSSSSSCGSKEEENGESMDVEGTHKVEVATVDALGSSAVFPQSHSLLSTTEAAPAKVTVTVTASDPVIPTGPPELPIPSQILLSSRKADEFLKEQAAVYDGASGDELPGVIATGKLLYILCILRDPAVQSLLLKFLSGRLNDMLKSKNAPPTLSRGITSGVQVGLLGAVMGKKILFPHEDVICKFALQLCQLSTSNDHEMGALDQVLLRAEIPMVMFDILCCSSSLSGMEPSVSTSSADEDDESLARFIAKSSNMRQHTEIAQHSVETCAKYNITESNITDSEAQLRLNMLGTIAKHLLELNPLSTK